MPWLQVKVHCSATAPANAVEDTLLALGAEAITLLDAADQPILEPAPGSNPVWDDAYVQALFAADCDTAQLHNQAEALLGTSLNWQAEPLADQVWERAWLDQFQPMRFGERLWIVPSAYQAPDPSAVNIQLDPGMAFGTGTHATTALCLQQLDSWADWLPGKEVLDFGCGSGILGIAAAKLGAGNVTGIDIDPQAITASQQNAATNQVNAHWYENASDPGQDADLLMANILAKPLLELAPVLAARVRHGGRILLSGILAQQQAELLNAYQPWFELSVQPMDDWIRISGQRK